MGRLRTILRQTRRYPVATLVVALALAGLAIYLTVRQLSAMSHFRAAQRAMQESDFAAARAHLAECLRTWPDSGETLFLAARAARRAGAYDEAAQHLRAYQRLGGVPEAFELEQALMLAQRGTGARVEGYLLDCVNRDHPDSGLMLEALVQGYLKTYRLTYALHFLQVWLQREPDNVQALFWRGEALERRNSYLEAMTDYRRILELNPDHDRARLRLAELLLYSHQAGDAVGHYELLSQRQPDNPVVHLGLARCQRDLGNTDAARQVLDTLLAGHPDYVDALGERGRLALQTGQPAEAEEWLRRALDLAPYDREVIYTFFQCLQQRGKQDEAKEYEARLADIEKRFQRLAVLTKKIAEKPEDASLRCEVGQIFLECGQDTEGLRWLDSALQEDPQHGPTHQVLADYYRRKEDPTQAAHHQQLAQDGQAGGLAPASTPRSGARAEVSGVSADRRP
jgi:predicted Zn-dependent protease